MFEKNTYTEQEFREVVKNNYSIRSCLIALGLKGTGGNYALFRRRVKILDLDTSHFTGKGHLKGKKHDWKPKKSLDEILVSNSTYTDRGAIKKRLLEKGLLTYECSACGLSDWLGKPISLHLDHINGINNDHRLENLRLLCPNCHSQTDTYAGKNKAKKVKTTKTTKVKVKKTYSCVDCGVSVNHRSKRCKSCAGKQQTNKINWPPVEELIEMVQRTNYSAVARQLGVSDNAVRKRIKRHK
jgi:5-methylcytosine-specific restriction endonuclease McrA